MPNDRKLRADEMVCYGRPVGVTLGPDKKSLLMADDVGDVDRKRLRNARRLASSRTTGILGW